jgi:Dyp-type peroxidase family
VAEAAPPPEPVLDTHDIQGDSLAGFRKDHEHFLFFTITNRASAKTALRRLAPRLSPLGDVAGFNALFRSVRRRRGEIPGTLSATWANVAFTAPGLSALTSAVAVAQFADQAFQRGLAVRSALLGDPTDPTAPGHPNQWLFGGHSNPVDMVLLVASDNPDSLAATSTELRQALTDGFKLAHFEACSTRPDLPGHEHFGFRDGISQPGPRGRLSSTSQDFLTPRVIDPSDSRSLRFGRPGQPLVWPGQFVLGLARQAIPPEDDLVPLPPLPAQPAWAANGSYLVIRRLRQDVAAFQAFLATEAARLAAQPGFMSMTPDRLGALLVGRWPSGAPLVRVPKADDTTLGQDSFASNDFGYQTANPPCPLRPNVHPEDHFAIAIADPGGSICPHAAHVRKVNPRDQGTDQGGPRATLRRLILRRGLPFGAPSDADRGLMFACYQASIEDQFEFLTTNWVNPPNKPLTSPGGSDLLIGQVSTGDRRRSMVLIGSDGSQQSVETTVEWVTPTGGGYFFAPSISAVRDVLAAD